MLYKCKCTYIYVGTTIQTDDTENELCTYCTIKKTGLPWNIVQINILKTVYMKFICRKFLSFI